MFKSEARVILHSTEYMELSQDVGRNVLVMRRTNQTFENIAVCRQECASLLRVMETAREVRGFVLDMRDAPARNDPAYEEATSEIRNKTYEWFRRVAIIFKSVAGKMQIRRLGGADAERTLVTVSEAEAYRFASVRRRESILPTAL